MYRKCTLLALVLFFSANLLGCAKDPGTPEEAVKRLLQQVRDGKWEEAQVILDMDSKAEKLFADIYAKADDIDKVRTREILTERFKESLEKEAETLGDKQPGYLARMLDDSGTLAEVTVEHSGSKFFYSLTLRSEFKDLGPTWVITDRTHETKGIRSSTAVGVRALLQRAEAKLGHPPSLAELNEILPDGMGAIKIRGFRVGSPAPGPPEGTPTAPVMPAPSTQPTP